MSVPFISFGATTIKTTRMGLGMAALGRPGYINLGHGNDFHDGRSVDNMRAKAHNMMDCAWRMGIRYFDAARSYGKAEEFIGSWKNKQGQATIGSKWGYTYTAEWQVTAEKHEIKEHSVEVLERQWQETLNALGQRPTIYHIHSATTDSGVLTNERVLNRLWKLKESGTIIGLSTSGTSQAETVLQSLQIKKGDTYLFGSLQITWNILEQSALKAIKLASEAGYGIIVKEGLANGRLTTRNNLTQDQEILNELLTLSQQLNCKLDQLALAYLISQPWVDVVLSGAATPEQLDSNIRALDVHLSDDYINTLKHISQSPDDYWNTRKSLSWN